jgi:hypothetical protein
MEKLPVLFFFHLPVLPPVFKQAFTGKQAAFGDTPASFDSLPVRQAARGGRTIRKRFIGGNGKRNLGFSHRKRQGHFKVKMDFPAGRNLYGLFYGHALTIPHRVAAGKAGGIPNVEKTFPTRGVW